MLENKRLNSGITLLALVVTIILLLIIAGISIASIVGENSIINKAKNEHELSQAQESLATELASILANNEGNKDLKKLDNMKINGYTTKVSDIARLVILTKNNVAYNFLVDSNYNIQKLDNISWSNQNTGSGTNLKEKIPISINLKDIGTKYKIDIIAIDVYGKTKMASSTWEVTTPNMIVETLQYPIMTTKGMVNTKADALDKIYQSNKKVYL